jgi:hypothetical protein
LGYLEAKTVFWPVERPKAEALGDLEASRYLRELADERLAAAGPGAKTGFRNRSRIAAFGNFLTASEFVLPGDVAREFPPDGDARS